MVSVTSLWAPILLSAVIVFFASFVVHMLLPYHRGDYRQLPEEDKLLAAMRSTGLARGLYRYPFGTFQEMKSPAMLEKYKQGPVGTLSIFSSGPPNMPKLLGMWFAYSLIVGFFVAYLVGHTVAAGATYPAVFRVAGTAAFMSYGLGQLINSIWKGQPWGMTIKEVADGLVYGLLTAGTFGWLWPR